MIIILTKLDLLRIMLRLTTFLSVLMLLSSFTFSSKNDSKDKAKKQTISGVITDEFSGEPLTGVKVKINSNTEVYTDLSGQFSVEIAAEENYIINIDYISYFGKQIVLKNNTEFQKIKLLSE